MATVVQLKRSAVPGKVPDAANLEVGELAINFADGLVYSKNTSGNVVVVASTTTSNIFEGTNLYFTNARAIGAFTAGDGIQIDANGLLTVTVSGSGGAVDSVNGLTGVVVLTTANIAEQGNLYYTDERVYSNVTLLNYATESYVGTQVGPAFDQANIAIDYSTNAYNQANIATTYSTAAFSQANSSVDYIENILPGVLSNIDSNTGNAFNQANVATTNANGAFIQANTALTNAGSAFDTANLKANITDLTTANVAELSNLYFTNARVNVAVSSQTLENATFTGNVVASNINVHSFIDFTPIPHDDYLEGRLFYDIVHRTINFYSDIVDFPVELGQSELIRIYNNTGNTIVKGAPVTLTGVTAEGIPLGVLADASTAALYNFSGLAGHDILDSSFGLIVAAGAVRDFDTSGLIEGQRAFVGFAQPGTLVQPSPSYPNYPMCVGYVAKSNATSGVFIVEQQNHSVESFRVLTDARVDGTLTVSNLTVLGSETAVTVNNLQVADTFVYLNSGDTANTTFNGVGLNDATFTGHYNNTTVQSFYVRIDGNSGPDTFEWSLDNFSTTEATGVTITGEDQPLRDSISIRFEATVGHNIGDVWIGNVAPINLDIGIVGNRNTGESGVGYTHLGVFFDVSDERFKFFDAYAPEVEGDVDVGDVSFNLGNVQAKSFIASSFQGIATSALKLQTARNINLTGNVVGTVSFDGTSDVSIATTTNTSNVPEGTNLYFTNARAVGAFTAGDQIILDANGLITANVTSFSVTISNTAPVSPSEGDLYWDEELGRLFIYYTDADSSQWVDASSPGAASKVTNIVLGKYINESFVANGTGSTFVVGNTIGTTAETFVFVDGVIQEPVLNYNVTDGVVTFTSPPDNGANIFVRYSVGTDAYFGNFLPIANLTYNLGSPEFQWKELYLSGNTINLGGAQLKTNPSTGALAIIPAPTEENPNPKAAVITATGTITTADTTGGEVSEEDLANAVTSGASITGAAGNLIIIGRVTNTTLVPVSGNITVEGRLANTDVSIT